MWSTKIMAGLAHTFSSDSKGYYPITEEPSHLPGVLHAL